MQEAVTQNSTNAGSKKKDEHQANPVIKSPHGKYTTQKHTQSHCAICAALLSMCCTQIVVGARFVGALFSAERICAQMAL